MDDKHRGIEWWESLHAWQKMAVVRNFPLVRGSILIKILGLKSRNAITSVRTRINDRQRFGKNLPQACSPEEAGELVIPPAELAMSGPKAKPKFKRYIQKPQADFKPEESAPPKPLTLAKPKPCCEAGCPENAVPKLSFCPTHARLRYKPMTPQKESLIKLVEVETA